MPDFIADSEIVAFKGNLTNFSELQGRINLEDPEKIKESKVKVYCYLLDLMWLDGHDLSRLGLKLRKKILKKLFDFNDPLRFLPHKNEKGEKFLKKACKKGWEGLIAKKGNGPYKHKRSKDWLKFKCAKRQEFVIAGFTDPQNSRKGFGALLIGYYEDEKLMYAGKVGTGYDDETLEMLHERLTSIERKTSPFNKQVKEKKVHWVSPKLVCEVGYTEWTADHKLRHPRYLGLRKDKKAKNVIREKAE